MSTANVFLFAGGLVWFGSLKCNYFIFDLRTVNISFNVFFHIICNLISPLYIASNNLHSHIFV